ncbi:MAG: hypothetical protein ABID83_04495 [Candidatus Omnitrophota bacterium]
MRYPKILFLLLFFIGLVLIQPATSKSSEGLFFTLESKDEFADEMSLLIQKAWKKWQDTVLVSDIDVDGSRGLLLPGDIEGPVLTASSILKNFDRKGKPQEYIDCVRVVAGAVENGMRSWQRGYSNEDLIFPQGDSCTFTLPPCNNVPVIIGSGRSSGDNQMTESALYNYMLYHTPRDAEDILIVFRASAEAISGCFVKWKNSCSIIGILATGGIAPRPVPMGSGPGPVRGAKGHEGKLVGAYFDDSLMRGKMMEYFREHKNVALEF